MQICDQTLWVCGLVGPMQRLQTKQGWSLIEGFPWRDSTSVWPRAIVDEMEFDSADKASILELINTLITAYGDYYIAVVDYHF